MEQAEKTKPHKFESLLNVLLFFFFLLALVNVSISIFSEQKSLLCLVDISSSIPEESLRQTEETLKTLQRKSKHHACTVNVLPFAQTPFQINSPITQQKFPKSQLEKTNISAALRKAAEIMIYNPASEIILFSDGNQTAENAAAAARGVGVPVSAVPFLESVKPEIALNDIRVPSRVHLGQPFEMTIRIRSTCEANAELLFFENSVEKRRIPISVKEGENEYRFPQTLESSARWKVQIHSDSDTNPENNQLTRYIELTDPFQVLLLTNEEEAVRLFTEQLQYYKFQVSVEHPESFPADLSQLRPFSAILLSNISGDDLTQEQISTLESYVRDQGNALFLFGGPRTFSAGNYAEKGLDSLLPVTSDFGPDRQKSRTALTLIIDRSGSMKGEKLRAAQEGILAAAEQLRGSDLLSIILFDQNLEKLIPLEPVSFSEDFRTQVASITAGGGTNIEPALREGIHILETAETARKHIILLSDGFSSPFDPEPLIQEAVKQKITFSVIGIGEKTSEEILKQLAVRTDGAFCQAETAAQIPQFFLEETDRIKKSGIEESEFIPRLLTSGEETILPSPLPPLQGYLRTAEKPESRVILETADHRPLLASWRLGLGSVTVWTSDITARWSSDWLNMPEYPQFWSAQISLAENPLEFPKEPESDYPPELKLLPANETLLRQLADITGGTYYKDIDQFLETHQIPQKQKQPIHLRNLFIFLALVTITVKTVYRRYRFFRHWKIKIIQSK